MPQFDHSSFASQIFWLAICFGALYIAMSRIFLPRIRDVFQTRNSLIEKNDSAAFQLQKQIDETSLKTTSLKEKATSQYKITIDQFIKQAQIKKEKELHDLKEEIIRISDDSKKEIIQFKEKSQDDCQKIIGSLASQIKDKFFAYKN